MKKMYALFFAIILGQSTAGLNTDKEKPKKVAFNVLGKKSPVESSGLHNAIQSGDISQISQHLSDDRTVIHNKDHQGRTPLIAFINAAHRFSFADFFNCLGIFIKYGAEELNAYDNNRIKPLVHILKESNFSVEKKKEIIYLFVKSNEKSIEGVLDKTLYRSDLPFDLIRFLIDNGAQLKDSQAKYNAIKSLIAASYSIEKKIEILLEIVNDTKKMNDGSCWLKDSDENNLVHYLCTSNHPLDLKKALLYVLLEHVCTIHEKNNFGQTALHVLSNSDIEENTKIEIMKLLIKRGAAIDCVDKNGKTPLLYAKEKDEKDVEKLLLNPVANTPDKDKKDKEEKDKEEKDDKEQKLPIVHIKPQTTLDVSNTMNYKDRLLFLVKALINPYIESSTRQPSSDHNSHDLTKPSIDLIDE